ncbi:MAG: hypothetical protein JEZ10_02535 [Verrucomicrobia bacterium]|nr:hypothetical protein [Verrucomicrobiota bacterium]
MRKNAIHLFFGLLLSVGLLAAPAQADLGLKQILADQGVKAVGLAVKAAAEAVYASTDDPKLIEAGLIAILNEAEATGDMGVMPYAIVGVMMAGGVENLDLSKQAINNSNLFVNYPNNTAITVANAEKLIRSGGGASETGGAGEKQQKAGSGGDEQEGGGGGGDEFGGDNPNPFDPGADDRGDDHTTPFTPV